MRLRRRRTRFRSDRRATSWPSSHTRPDDGRNTVLVTHTANLLYSFGLQAQPEGIAHVFRPAVVGPAVYLGAMLPGDWGAFAETAARSP